MASQPEGPSLVCIHSSEAFPKTPTTKDDDELMVPFPPLSGECVKFLGKTSDGIIALSNYRLLIRCKDSFVNIPVRLIESIECRDIFYMNINCKDGKCIRCTFATNESCLEWFKRLSNLASPPEKLEELFAYPFYAWCTDPSQEDYCEVVKQSVDDQSYTFGKEIDRLGFNLKNKTWRISHINEKFSACSSYPKYHLVPYNFSDEDLQSVLSFRMSRRFPSVVWRSQSNGAVIVRCSQPEVGWLGWRNTQDENLLKEIAVACVKDEGKKDLESALEEAAETEDSKDTANPEPRKMLIIDARSYSAAFANRAKGGGCECPEYYPNCEIQFMNLANIHTVRKSFQSLRLLCSAGSEQSSWLTSLENTKWLQHIAAILKSALIVVHAVDKEKRSVVVHCSDGWDRTPQITALAQLLLDPYYRTIQGFQILVEKEWLDFGHKFGDRCGHGVNSDDANERCPVFLQWLDCVHQLIFQFPCAFEFNEAFLVKLAQHMYSCLFGTFLCNSAQERDKEHVRERTFSVWTLLRPECRKYTNYLYSPQEDVVLRPSCNLRAMRLWSSVYMSGTVVLDTRYEDAVEATATEEKPESLPLQKTRSCDDIVAALETTSNVGRRLSDPNISETKYDPNSLLEHQNKLNLDIQKTDEKTDNMILLKDEEGDKVEHETTVTENGHLVNGESPAKIDSEAQCNGYSNGNVSDEASDDVKCNGHDLSPVTSNGHMNDDSEEESEKERLAIKLTAMKSNSRTSLEDVVKNHSINSSTDTLTAEEGAIIEENGSRTNLTNGHSSTSLDKLPLKNNSSSSKTLTSLEQYSDISTSTTELTDSHVNAEMPKLLQNKMILEEVISSLNAGSVNNRQQRGPGLGLVCNVSSKASSCSTESEMSTPFQCRTPSSTCPPTPGTESKMDLFPHKSMSVISKHLDCDGLTTFEDPVHNQLQEIHRQNEARITMLQKQFKTALCQIAANCNGKYIPDRDEVISLPESIDADEHTSLASNATSETSWEPLEEKDVHMTLWVPDHAVTHCAGCDSEFWIVRRKHHCRNCGKIYCSECTKYVAPVPAQQLYEPCRVCRQCFITLRMAASSHTMEVADCIRQAIDSPAS